MKGNVFKAEQVYKERENIQDKKIVQGNEAYSRQGKSTRKEDIFAILCWYVERKSRLTIHFI